MSLKEFLKSIHGAMDKLALAVVITVVCGIFVFPLFYSRKEVKEVRAELEAIGAGLEQYRAENGAWPSSSGALAVSEALIGNGGKGFVAHERRDRDGRLIDPWEKPFRYFFSNDGFVIQSAGKNGKFAEGLDNGSDDYWFVSP